MKGRMSSTEPKINEQFSPLISESQNNGISTGKNTLKN
jgi:hypothetical protein